MGDIDRQEQRALVIWGLAILLLIAGLRFEQQHAPVVQSASLGDWAGRVISLLVLVAIAATDWDEAEQGTGDCGCPEPEGRGGAGSERSKERSEEPTP